MWKHDSERINSESHPINYCLLAVVFFANWWKARKEFSDFFALKYIFKKNLCFRERNTFLGLQEDDFPVHTNAGVHHWLFVLPGAISEAEPLYVMFYCRLGRVGTQSALA